MESLPCAYHLDGHETGDAFGESATPIEAVTTPIPDSEEDSYEENLLEADGSTERPYSYVTEVCVGCRVRAVALTALARLYFQV